MTCDDEFECTTQIDVVLATRQSALFLADCLESIRAQGIAGTKVTIIDAHSTDGTREIASQAANVVVIEQSGSGLAQAWNQGIRAGSHDFVAIIDSDDYWSPDFLRSCLSEFKTSPWAQCVITKVKFVLASHHIPIGFRPELVDAERIGWMPGATLFRRSVFEHVGLFPEDMMIASDIEWFARLRENGVPIVLLETVGLYKRIHESNLSLSGAAPEVYRREVLRVARSRRGNVPSRDLGANPPVELH